MTVTERFIGGVTVLDVTGPIVVTDGGASQFGTRVRHALHQGHIQVVVNLGAVPYIDSTALGELVRTFITASQMGGGVKLLHVGSRVRNLLTVAKLLPVFDVFDDEAAALASFGETKIPVASP